MPSTPELSTEPVNPFVTVFYASETTFEARCSDGDWKSAEGSDADALNREGAAHLEDAHAAR